MSSMNFTRFDVKTRDIYFGHMNGVLIEVVWSNGQSYSMMVRPTIGTQFITDSRVDDYDRGRIETAVEKQQAVASDFLFAFRSNRTIDGLPNDTMTFGTPTFEGETATMYLSKFNVDRVEADKAEIAPPLSYAPFFTDPTLGDSVEAAQTSRDATASQVAVKAGELADEKAETLSVRTEWEERKAVLSDFNSAISSKDSTISDLEAEIASLNPDVEALEDEKSMYTKIAVGSTAVGLGSFLF